MVIGWALRWVLLCCGLVLLGVGMLDRGAALLPDPALQSGSDARPASGERATGERATGERATGERAAGERATGPPSNTIVYVANQRGHVVLDAAVNGAPVRMLVDTGASLVTLTPQDARAAGIAPSELVYNTRVNTANGTARMAPVTLREIRIDQLTIYDVPAAVLENLDLSLLGMSFLTRLQGYEMRDGKLTITW
jgi:aspartyl protease family protein